jgi:hypothetical protein
LTLTNKEIAVKLLNNVNAVTALQLLKFGREQKTPAPYFFHVGTSIKTQSKPQTQTSPPWQASAPSSGANLLDKPIPVHGQHGQGVGRGRSRSDLMKSVNWLSNKFLFSYSIIYNVNKCNKLAGNFKNHAAGMIWRKSHSPMKRIRGFTRSYWMLSSDDLLEMSTFLMSSKVNFEDIFLCHPDVSARHGQHVANIATFVVFFTSYVESCCWLPTCWQCNNQQVWERRDKRGGSAMREVSAVAMQQRMTRKWHWVVVEAMGNGDGGDRCGATANITISQARWQQQQGQQWWRDSDDNKIEQRQRQWWQQQHWRRWQEQQWQW